MAERKFRDGKREIPDYMDDLMGALETDRLTYEEAVKRMNNEMVAQHLDHAVDQRVISHFRGMVRR